MKSFKALLCISALAAVAAAPVTRAEGASTPAPAAPAKENLTPAQKAKIDALLKEEHKEIAAIKADAKTTEAEKKAKTKAVRDSYKEKIAAVKAGK